MGRCNQPLLGHMSKSSSKDGLQCCMLYQLLAAFHLSTAVTAISLLPLVSSFCFQVRVAQPVLQAHLQPQNFSVNPENQAEID